MVNGAGKIACKQIHFKENFRNFSNFSDLMLPGVIVKGQVNLYTFKGIQKDSLCCICLAGNKLKSYKLKILLILLHLVLRVPIAIGRTSMCGEDMYMSGMRGKCVTILHIYQDQLWALGDQSIQPPIIPNSEIVAEGSTDEEVEKGNEIKKETEEDGKAE